MKLEEKLVCFLKFPRPVLVKIAHLEIRTVICTQFLSTIYLQVHMQ